MTFYSPEFIFVFLPCFVALCSMARGKARSAFLFFGSLIFYWFASGKELLPVALICVIILFNYLLGRIIELYSGGARKAWLAIGIICDSALLLSPKVLEIITGGADLSAVSFVAPVGYSFYMFKNMSYIRQVYDKKIVAERSFIALGAYLALFSQILSGPIQTYSDFRTKTYRNGITPQRINSGLYEFIIGLALKILLADRIIRVWITGLYGINSIGVQYVSTPLAWLGFFSFPLYLYFEFYGYSLMSRGIGRMLGYETPDNFLFPYISRTVGEFWRRWHMTLGEWFKENVYFPLGGNRKGTARTLFNLTVVWVLTGVWHALCFNGNGINFMLWAGFLWVFIILEKLKVLDFITNNRVASHIYLVVVILFSWAFFNTNLTTLADLGAYFTRLFPFFGQTPEFVNPSDWQVHLKDVGAYMAVGALFITPWPRALFEKYKDKHYITVPLMLVLFWISVYFIFREGANPMVY